MWGSPGVPTPMSTKICTVVIYSHSKLVLKYLGMYNKISRLRLGLLFFVGFPIQSLYTQPLHVKEVYVTCKASKGSVKENQGNCSKTNLSREILIYISQFFQTSSG